MTLRTEFELVNFETWDSATETKETIIEAGKADEFDSLLDDIFPEGATDTEVNDYLWFDDEDIFRMLGIDTEDNEEDEEAADEEIDEE